MYRNQNRVTQSSKNKSDVSFGLFGGALAVWTGMVGSVFFSNLFSGVLDLAPLLEGSFLALGAGYCLKKTKSSNAVAWGALAMTLLPSGGSKDDSPQPAGDLSPPALQQSITQNFNGTGLSSPVAKSLITTIKAVNAKFS